MLSFDEALEAILREARPLPIETVALDSLLGYALAEPITASFDMPRFDNSAVDGYGVMIADVQTATEQQPVKLKMAGEIQAGAPDRGAFAPGTAVKILTGATVPPDVEAVVMREFCTERNGHVEIACPASSGENIRRRAAEFRTGDEVLPKGIRVTPPVVGLLANFGLPRFAVHSKPRVSLVVTGDELVPPGGQLQSGQIYDSNSFALAAAVESLGLRRPECFRARDSKEATADAFQKAMADADVIISSGGVSVGDYDFVKDTLESLGVETKFWRIAIKPGKPVYFGVKQRPGERGPQLVFGLPGNPVSVLVTYHQLVKPALLKLLGQSKKETKFTGVLQSRVQKKPGRLDFVRGTLSTDADSRLSAQPTKGQDSHMLSGLARADCLIYFAADCDRLEQGVQTSVDILDWSS